MLSLFILDLISWVSFCCLRRGLLTSPRLVTYHTFHGQLSHLKGYIGEYRHN